MDKFYMPDHCRQCDELAKLLELDDVPIISGTNKPFDIEAAKAEWIKATTEFMESQPQPYTYQPDLYD